VVDHLYLLLLCQFHESLQVIAFISLLLGGDGRGGKDGDLGHDSKARSDREHLDGLPSDVGLWNRECKLALTLRPSVC